MSEVQYPSRFRVTPRRHGFKYDPAYRSTVNGCLSFAHRMLNLERYSAPNCVEIELKNGRGTWESLAMVFRDHVEVRREMSRLGQIDQRIAELQHERKQLTDIMDELDNQSENSARRNK